jgi:hypothetical protein
MAKNNTTMLEQFVETNDLFKNMDAQIWCLIDKLQVT